MWLERKGFLAKALCSVKKASQSAALEDHNYSSITSEPGLPAELRDHDYANYHHSGVLIDLQYGDDICSHAT